MYPSDNEFITPQAVALRLRTIQAVMKTCVYPGNLQLHVSQDFDGALVHRLRADIAGETLKVYRFRAPKDWWQAVRERFCPAWAKARWPIQYREEKVEAEALYPLVSFPEKVHHIRVLRTRRPEDFQSSRL